MAEQELENGAATNDLSALVIPLLKGVIYEEGDANLWNALINLQARVRDYVTVLGLELVLDEAEGYAFLRSRQEAALEAEFPNAELVRARGDEEGSEDLRGWIASIGEHLRGTTRDLEIALDVGGTPLQRRVWNALRRIPYGETRSYAELAAAAGAPRAIRAVASACAKNPVALVVPCHRAVRKGGGLGGYRWGLDRKARLLAHERGIVVRRVERV